MASSIVIDAVFGPAVIGCGLVSLVCSSVVLVGFQVPWSTNGAMPMLNDGRSAIHSTLVSSQVAEQVCVVEKLLPLVVASVTVSV